MPLLILCWPQCSPAPKLSCIRDRAKQTLKERTFFERSLLNVGVLTIPQLELKHKKDVFCLPQYKERGTERQKNSRQAAAWERAATRRTQHECETSTGTVKERNTDAFKNDNKSWQSLSAWFFFFCYMTISVQKSVAENPTRFNCQVKNMSTFGALLDSVSDSGIFLQLHKRQLEKLCGGENETRPVNVI